MELSVSITVPAKSFTHAWVARIVGNFPMPKRSLVADPDTGETITLVTPQDGQLQLLLLPCQKLESGELVADPAQQVRTVSMSALMAQPGVADAMATISQAILATAQP